MSFVGNLFKPYRGTAKLKPFAWTWEKQVLSGKWRRYYGRSKPEDSKYIRNAEPLYKAS